MVDVLSRLIVNLVKIAVCAVTRAFNWFRKVVRLDHSIHLLFLQAGLLRRSRLTSSMQYLYIGDLGPDHDN